MRVKPPKQNPFLNVHPGWWAALGVVAVAGLVTFVVMAQQRLAGNAPTPTPTKGNSTVDEPSASPSPSLTMTPAPPGSATPNPGTPTPTAAPVAKLALQKSAGNAPGSSVPAGIVIEFTCEGAEGLGCELILTNRTNPAQVVNLGKKTITGNGRGQYFATWDWTAVKGSWNVTAKASNAAGGSATSDTQVLEVK